MSSQKTASFSTPPDLNFNVFKNFFFSISTSENVYLDKNISILGGLEAEILIRTQIWSAIL